VTLGKKIEGTLERFFTKGKTPHAFLVLGDEEAREQAEKLFVKFLAGLPAYAGRPAQAGDKKLNPDLFVYDGAFLGIEDAHEIGRKALQGAWGEAKVFLIKSAVIGREAAAALLKLLEEPPEKTYFIISAVSENFVSAPLYSRLVVIRLGIRPTKKDAELLKKMDLQNVQRELLFAPGFSKEREKTEEFLRVFEFWIRDRIKGAGEEKTKEIRGLLEDFFEIKKRLAARTYGARLLLEHLIISKSYLRI